MLIVDFSHLANRNLFTSVFNARPKKKDGKYITEDFIGMYMHQMFTSLKYLRRQFREDEIVLAIDSRMNWRKDVYPDYKSHRKKVRDESEINFDEFFKYNAELIQALRESFPYKVVEVDRAEADDVIFVLAEQYAKEKDVIVVTEDKDMKIVLSYGAKMYMPIKKEYVNMTPEELSLWVKTHICLGDDSDNIPHIMYNKKFSNEYRKFLDNKNITFDEYEYEIQPFKFRFDLEEEFDEWYLNKKGQKVEKKIYTKQRWGEKSAEKFAKNLAENLSGESNEKALLRVNFARNKQLIHPSGLPEIIKEQILNAYNSTDTSCNYNGMMQYLLKHSLTEHIGDIGSFVGR